MFDRILAVVRAEPDRDQPLLERAMELGNPEGRLHLFAPVRNPLAGADYHFLTPELRHQVRHRALTRVREQLEREMSELHRRGRATAYHLEWVSEGTAELIGRLAGEQDCDAVLMERELPGHQLPGDIRRFLRHNTERHTVLLPPGEHDAARKTGGAGRRPVLAAVETLRETPEARALATRVIRDAGALAAHLDCPLQLVTVAPDVHRIEEDLRHFLGSAEEPGEILRGEHQQRLESLLQASGITVQPTLWVRAGAPGLELPALAAEQRPTYLVMGRSAAPAGLSAIWRTTNLEKMLSALHCNVVVVPGE